MSMVAIIPARGGSKRLPRKNILEIAGKPLLAYSIDTARATGLFDEIYVSTEDKEIGCIAKQYGARILDRPEAIATDRSTVVDVCLHALEVVPDVEIFCCIYATSILLKSETVIEGYHLLNAEPISDFVMGVSLYEHPPVQALRTDDAGYLSYMWPEWRGVQSQFQPQLLVSNGTFYWARREAIRAEKTFYGKRLRGVCVPRDQVSDIDTREDFISVSQYMSSLRSRRV